MNEDTLTSVALVDGLGAALGVVFIVLGRQGDLSGVPEGRRFGLGAAVFGGALVGFAAIDASKRLRGQETF